MSLDFYIVDHCEHCGRGGDSFDFNITHNLTALWRELGCYGALYEGGGCLAKEALPALKSALITLSERPASDFGHLMPENGWGTVEGAAKFLRRVIQAIEAAPNGVIRVSK